MRWPPPTRPLVGEIVRLEPIEERHREGLAAVAGAGETWEWLDPRVPEDRGAFDAWFDARLAATRRTEERCFVTCRATDGEAIGSSSYLNVRLPHDGLEIGWTWLHPSTWRTGANVDAKLLMLAHAFDALGCMRVEFKTDARNRRSGAALAALPAKFEGVLRKHQRTPIVGVRDSAYYLIVDDEWPAVREGLSARSAARRGRQAEVAARA